MMGSEQPLAAPKWGWTANQCCPKTIQGISPHVFCIFFSWEVEQVVIAEPRTTRAKDQAVPNQTAILSLSTLYPKIAVEGWQVGLQVLQSQHSNTPGVFPSRIFAQCSSVVSPTPSPPAAPLNPLCPSLDPREQDLLVPQSLTCTKWAVTILNNFLL